MPRNTPARAQATIFTGVGSATIFVGDDDDQFRGGMGADLLFGGAGEDGLMGMQGNDILLGQGGACRWHPMRDRFATTKTIADCAYSMATRGRFGVQHPCPKSEYHTPHPGAHHA